MQSRLEICQAESFQVFSVYGNLLLFKVLSFHCDAHDTTWQPHWRLVVCANRHTCLHSNNYFSDWLSSRIDRITLFFQRTYTMECHSLYVFELRGNSDVEHCSEAARWACCFFTHTKGLCFVSRNFCVAATWHLNMSDVAIQKDTSNFNSHASNLKYQAHLFCLVCVSSCRKGEQRKVIFLHYPTYGASKPPRWCSNCFRWDQAFERVARQPHRAVVCVCKYFPTPSHQRTRETCNCHARPHNETH